ncbi:hypothetical protein [Paenarthrobacter ilicis]|uniref:hypothetical protein n=1 Tax=Paenarthrobacter ilicis TaxID=43665 RepID=UPI0028D6DD3D|nr:hypothetical protein [Paenarthrobacter ilicis]
MAYSFDTRESEDEERAGLLLIQNASERIKAILNAPDWLEPQPGSHVAAVDLLTPYQPMSAQLRSFNMVAVDNLRATTLYIEKTNDVPMMALYSMIRSAVEATSYGLWIVNAGTNQKQAFLSLRLAYENNADLASLGKTFAPGDESGSRVSARLLELQQNLPRYRGHDLSNRVTTTDVVTNADRVVGPRQAFSGLQVWKSCSGLAHGNSAVMPMLLERKFTGESDDRGAMFRLTSRLTFIGGFLITAVENLEALRTQYATKSRSIGKTRKAQ